MPKSEVRREKGIWSIIKEQKYCHCPERREYHLQHITKWFLRCVLLDRLTERGCWGCFLGEKLGGGLSVCFWSSDDFFNRGLTMDVFRSCGKLMMFVIVGKSMSRFFIKKCGGNGIEFTRLGRCTWLFLRQIQSSVTGSKVSKGFPAKEASGQAVGFGGGKLFSMLHIFLVK